VQQQHGEHPTSERSGSYPARDRGGHLPDRRDREEFADRRDRSRSPDRRDRSRSSPDRRAVEAAGSAADRAIYRHGLPPFVRRHMGVADAEDAVQFACSNLPDGGWWSLANLTKQLYACMPEMRVVLAGPGKKCAAAFFESYGFDILAEPKMDVLIRWRGGSSTAPRCKWAGCAMQACFDIVHERREGMMPLGKLAGEFYRHPVAQEHQLERFFRVPKGVGMKAWLSLTQEGRERFEVLTLDGMPNDPYVRLTDKLKRRSQFIWWVSDRLREAEGGTMFIDDVIREHDRISPISFAVATVGWDGRSLSSCFSQCPNFQVEMRYDAFARKEKPVIKLLASTS